MEKTEPADRHDSPQVWRFGLLRRSHKLQRAGLIEFELILVIRFQCLILFLLA
jgi:hypothetical protein